jgi:PAS domain S-box-containing protein
VLNKKLIIKNKISFNLLVIFAIVFSLYQLAVHHRFALHKEELIISVFSLILGLSLTGIIRIILDKNQIIINKLSISKKSFKLLAENIPQMVWTATPNGKVDYFNRQWFNYVNKTFAETKDSGWMSLIHPDDLDKTIKILDQATRTRSGSYEIDYRIKGKDGNYRWFLGRALAILDSDQNILKWFGTNTDIDNQKKNEHEITNCLKLREDFISIASHELKTPLTSIKLQTELLGRILSKDNFNLQEVKSIVNINSVQIDRLVKMINSMLDLTKIKQNSFKIERSPFNVIELVHDVLTKLYKEVKDYEIVVDAPSLLNVNWDRQKIEQVFINLISNAIKYGADNPIKISLELKDESVIIKVIDHGIGILPDDFSKIFNKFERSKNHNSSKITGLGLGLYIVKNIIDEHDGTISVSSNLGKETTFTIEMPIGL